MTPANDQENDKRFVTSIDPYLEAAQVIDSLNLPTRKHHDFIKVFGFIRLKRDGIVRNLAFAVRGCEFLSYYTLIAWAISFILLSGSLVNYFILEDLDLYASSHDARIERVSKPIKVSDL